MKSTTNPPNYRLQFSLCSPDCFLIRGQSRQEEFFLACAFQTIRIHCWRSQSVLWCSITGDEVWLGLGKYVNVKGPLSSWLQYDNLDKVWDWPRSRSKEIHIESRLLPSDFVVLTLKFLSCCWQTGVIIPTGLCRLNINMLFLRMCWNDWCGCFSWEGILKTCENHFPFSSRS